METVGVSTLKNNLKTFLKKVKNGESITIISRGHEVARLVPPFDKIKNARKALEELRSTAFIGDVISPLDVEWECNS
ncbi:MAG: type II toxin-antitoxin system Phd/YefM family antitoxin [Candidatus Aminicenantes bacterium]|jgi:prevent-host-death family protein|nr:type II toxin-antitoxin system Phd/YefM family antitoxin [Candidatus Aminicenantes bacterium]